MTLSKKIPLSIVLVGAVAVPSLAFFVFTSGRRIPESSFAASHERNARHSMETGHRTMYQGTVDVGRIAENRQSRTAVRSHRAGIRHDPKGLAAAVRIVQIRYST